MLNSHISVVCSETVFDSVKGAEIRSKVEQLIQANAGAILIDFSNTTFMDSCGLGELVLLLKATRLARIPLYLCSLNDQCKMLFELTRADSIFEIFPDAVTVQNSMLELAA